MNLRRREHGRRWRAERDEGTGLNMVPIYIYEIKIQFNKIISVFILHCLLPLSAQEFRNHNTQ